MNTTDHFVSEFDASIVDYRSGVADYSFQADGAGSRAIEVEVRPWTGPSWVGTFAAPDPGIRAMTALLGTPNSVGLCVIERGSAFVGNVLEPAAFVALQTGGPVVAATEAVDERMLLLSTPWSVAAVDTNGVLWISERIAIDGLRVDEVSDGWVRGMADPGDEESRPFKLDLLTGQLVGGSDIV